jgi:hypothetical protein
MFYLQREKTHLHIPGILHPSDDGNTITDDYVVLLMLVFENKGQYWDVTRKETGEIVAEYVPDCGRFTLHHVIIPWQELQSLHTGIKLIVNQTKFAQKKGFQISSGRQS